MAEEYQESNVKNEEISDRGLFGFTKKDKIDDDNKDQQEMIATEFDHKVEVSEEEKHDHHREGGHLHKLHRSDSSSSSSSDEEEGDDEEKKRRRKEKKEKKGLKEKIKEKLPGHHKDEEEINVPVEEVHVEEVVYSEPSHPAPTYHEAEGEKKGFLEKIKDKLPGHQKKVEGEGEHDYVAPAPAPAVVAEGEGQEKKGFLDKIKERIPGFHSKAPEDEKKDVEKRGCEPPSSST